MRVIFFGNHTVGVRVLSALLEHTTVVGVVAHPDDHEDGVVYESVFEYSKLKKLNVIRSTGKSMITFNFVNKIKPDLIWVTDFKYIITENIFLIAPLGAVNIHPSLLPHYRGRASINWAIINGETKFGLTAHFIDKNIDTGDIIRQKKITIKSNDYIGNILQKAYPEYYEITVEVIELFKKGKVTRIPQLLKLPMYGKRTPEDGKIDWNQPIENIYNLIRAVSHPYPGAFTFLGRSKILIWESKIISKNSNNLYKNGQVIDVSSISFKVKCNSGILEITKYNILDFKINVNDFLN